MTFFIIALIVIFVCSILASNHEHKRKRHAAQRNTPITHPKSPACVPNDKPGYVRTTIDELKQYAESHGGNIGDLPLYVIMTRENADNTIDVSESVFTTIDRKIERRTKWDATYNLISEHRINGMNRESADDEPGAIESYLSAIRYGEKSKFDMLHAYRHAYDRLLVLLRRAHRYDELRAVCESYARHDIDEATRTRINKIIQSI